MKSTLLATGVGEEDQASTGKRSAAAPTPTGLPATGAIPDHSATGGDQQGLEQFHLADTEHVPRDNPDEDTNTFGDRERYGGFSQNAQMLNDACCAAAVQPAE